MGHKKFGSAVVLAVALVAAMSVGCASHKHNSDKSASAGSSAGALPPGMTAEQAKAMEQMMKPGPEHARLAKYAGKYNAEALMWMDPSQPPTRSTGKQTNTVIYGGRFLRGDYSGEWMGAAFKGVGILGYDNAEKKYLSTWMDDMGTAIMFLKGDADAAGKVYTFKADMMCPMTNSMQPVRQVLTFVDANTYTFDMYMTMPDGKENKMMKITYTRAKSILPW